MTKLTRMKSQDAGEVYCADAVDDLLEQLRDNFEAAKAESRRLALVLHDIAVTVRVCQLCGSASHVGDGHAPWCLVAKQLPARAVGHE